jgi:hypothetical protein
MNSYKVLFIKQNQIGFNDIGDYVSDLLYKENYSKTKLNDYLMNTIKDYIEEINVTDDDILEESYKFIWSFYPNLTPEDFNNTTETINMTKYGQYQILHCIPPKNHAEETTINNLASLLCLDNKILYGNCVLILAKFDSSKPESKYIKLSDVNKNAILNLIRRKYNIHSCQVLNKNDSITKMYFQNLMYLLKNLYPEEQKLTMTNISILDYNLVMIHTLDRTGIKNKSATKLCGIKIIFDNVVIVNKLDINEELYDNISTSEINKLISLSSGRLCDRSAKDSEAEYHNKHLLINHRYKYYYEKCFTCNKTLQNLDTTYVECDICHRYKYCDEKCMYLNRGIHTYECIKL